MTIHYSRWKETTACEKLVEILCLDKNIPGKRTFSEALVGRQMELAARQ